MPLAQDALARAQATIAALRTADTGGDIRWVRPESLHITLAFLGQVPPEAVAAVIDALAEVIRHDRNPLPTPSPLDVYTLRLATPSPLAVYPPRFSPDGHSLRSRDLALTLDAVELFPGPQRPQLIWYRVGGSTASLARLAYAVRASLSEITPIPDGSSFRLHVTLGRVRSGKRPVPWLPEALPEYDNRTPASWNPDGIELWRSEMGVGGSRYEPLARLPFLEG